MSSMKTAILSAAVVLALGLSQPALAKAAKSEGKGPPSCAAIAFRPIAAGMPDGDQEAGLYKSRFGKMELMASVQGGQAKDYFLIFNSKRLQPLSSTPKGAGACASQKRLPAPAKQIDACVGDRFKVAIESAAGRKTALLYALTGRQWAFCRAYSVEK